MAAAACGALVPRVTVQAAASLGPAVKSADPPLQTVKLGEYRLGLDGIDVGDRVDAAGDVGDGSTKQLGAEFVLIVFRINEHLGAIRNRGQM